MGFEALLGNDRLKENLTAGIGKGRISHCYLICGPRGSGKKTLARLLAAAILCKSPRKPCLSCSACRKVMADTHPDLITVRDPEHKNVAVKIVRQIRDDMFIRPNEADRKICLFPQDLGIEGQNALLKVLEEPPPYGVFLLLSENPEKLLTTVRSRCVELTLTGLPEPVLRGRLQQDFPQADPEAIAAAITRSGGYLGLARTLLEEGAAMTPQTQAFAKSFAARDAVGLLQTLVPMERWKREQLLEELNQWTALLQSALLCRCGMPAPSAQARALSTVRSAPELLNAVRQLQKASQYTQGNVSVAAVCGYLEWALR